MPIEFSLRIDIVQKYSQLMKTYSEFPLHLQDAAIEVLSGQLVDIKSTDITYIRHHEIIWSLLEVVVNLLEHGFRF